MKKPSLLALFGFISTLSAGHALAQCPVCTVGVIAGLGLSRYFGVDDTLSGIWIGGLLMSLSIWTVNWLKSKKWNFKGSITVIALAYYAMVIIPLYTAGLVGHPFNTLWGVDKLMVGVVAGTIIFTIATVAYAYVKNKNGGKAHFPFEKVVFPIGALAILSVIFYFVTK